MSVLDDYAEGDLVIEDTDVQEFESVDALKVNPTRV